MNFAKCILCGHDAQSNVFTEAKPDEQGRVNEAPGEKYDCPICGLYALDNYEHSYVELFVKDDQRFLMIKHEERESRPVKEMILIQNWFEELKRLVPTKK